MRARTDEAQQEKLNQSLTWSEPDLNWKKEHEAEKIKRGGIFMIQSMARSLVIMASPILFLIYLWNDIKTLSFDDRHHALSWSDAPDHD